MKRPKTHERKGLHDISTAIGSAGEGAQSAKVHMRLSSLEIERHRCETEKRAALDRLQRCDEQIRNIEKRVETLMRLLERDVRVSAVGGPIETMRTKPISQPERPKSSGDAVRFRY